MIKDGLISSGKIGKRGWEAMPNETKLKNMDIVKQTFARQVANAFQKSEQTGLRKDEEVLEPIIKDVKIKLDIPAETITEVRRPGSVLGKKKKVGLQKKPKTTILRFDAAGNPIE